MLSCSYMTTMGSVVISVYIAISIAITIAIEIVIAIVIVIAIYIVIEFEISITVAIIVVISISVWWQRFPSVIPSHGSIILMYWSVRWGESCLSWDVQLFRNHTKQRLTDYFGPRWFLVAWQHWHLWIQIFLQQCVIFLHPCMIRISGYRIQARYFMLLDGDPKPCIIQCIFQYFGLKYMP